MIDRSSKREKWTLMKYIKDFDLMVLYANAVRNGNADISDQALREINAGMEAKALYNPRYMKPSLDTIAFKICQIVYYMFAYKLRVGNSRSANKLVFSPLGNLLLDNIGDKKIVSRAFLCMLYAMPFNHPFNKMSSDFNLYPYRLIFRLLVDDRIDKRLYHDEVFYLVMFVKEINDDSYEDLIASILKLRSMLSKDKYKIFTKTTAVEDTLANALHEWNYACGILSQAGIIEWQKTNESIGVLIHGNDRTGKRSGKRSYKQDVITFEPNIIPFVESLLGAYQYDEKPHTLKDEVGLTSEYIIQLYNFYPPELLRELNITSREQESIVTILKITEDIKLYSRNSNFGDAYKFEDVLCNAFNCFNDVEAEKQAVAGTTDIECIYLPEDKKFDVEAKSTKNKLMGISAGRLKFHRTKIGSKYTIIITPNFTPAVLEDIKGTNAVIIRAASFSNYLYQAVSRDGCNMSYQPIDAMIADNLGGDITPCINRFVYDYYGIGTV